jgi:hypothetical protein
MHTQHVRREPLRLFATDGAAIVNVPLARGGAATLDASDFDALGAAGFTDQWTANSNGKGRSYVRGACKAGGRSSPSLASSCVPPRGMSSATAMATR